MHILHLALPSLLTGIIIFICSGVVWLVLWDNKDVTRNPWSIIGTRIGMLFGLVVVIFAIFWANIVGW